MQIMIFDDLRAFENAKFECYTGSSQFIKYFFFEKYIYLDVFLDDLRAFIKL